MQNLTVQTASNDTASRTCTPCDAPLEVMLRQDIADGKSILLLLSGAETLSVDGAMRYARSVSDSIGLGKGALPDDSAVRVYATYYPENTTEELLQFWVDYNKGDKAELPSGLSAFFASVNNIYQGMAPEEATQAATRINLVTTSLGTIFSDLLVQDVKMRYEPQQATAVLDGLKILEVARASELANLPEGTQLPRQTIFMNTSDKKIRESSDNFAEVEREPFVKTDEIAKAALYADTRTGNRHVYVSKQPVNGSYILRRRNAVGKDPTYTYRRFMDADNHNLTLHHHIGLMSRHPETGEFTNTNLIMPYAVKLTLLSMLEDSQQGSKGEAFPFGSRDVDYFIQKGYYQNPELLEEVFPHHKLLQKAFKTESSGVQR